MFADAAVVGATAVVVDVGELDDRHELTGFALLTELSRRLGENGGLLTVVNPPPRLAGHLQAGGIHVRWDVTPVPHDGPTMQVGPRPNRTHEIAVPAQSNGADRQRAR